MSRVSDDRKIFGTDGVRGVANVEPVTAETALRLGRAAAHVFLKSNPRAHPGGTRPKIVLGKDTRLSGYMLENALVAGITSLGVDVLVIGPLPTPGVAYITRSLRADAGIILSASHNSTKITESNFSGTTATSWTIRWKNKSSSSFSQAKSILSARLPEELDGLRESMTRSAVMSNLPRRAFLAGCRSKKCALPSTLPTARLINQRRAFCASSARTLPSRTTSQAG